MNYGRQSFRPPQPPHVVAKTLKYNEAQEHLLRRLGSALVLQWDELPDALQDLIIDQAAAVEDRDEAAHDSTVIEAFIRNAKVIALSKPPAVPEAK
ncbi:MAG: hypothetical protein H7124_09985 [Phycisphaerales bacterium]|nr:hypothetical protein [Hyphomonadaceae bacterium]